MRKALFTFLLISFITLLGACSDSDSDAAEEADTLDDDKLVIGVTAGLHEEVMEVVADLAEEEDLEIEIKSFSDYVLPNTALDEGDLDVNSYQHEPFLDQFNEDHETDLVPVGATILNPMGIYSEDLTDLDDFPEEGKFGLPNDPTNGSRSLLILEEAGLIKLDEDAGVEATIHDVTENDRNIEFVELDAAQIPKQLDEVDAASINTNFALEADLSPDEDAIHVEGSDSPYVNVLVVEGDHEDDPVIEKLVEIYQSDEVKEFVEDEYGGSVIVGW